MDIIHHALIGGSVYLVTQDESALLGIGFLVGSVFPDLDVVFILFGKRFYLKNHQGLTHSVILAPIYATLLGMFLSEWDLQFWLGVLLGTGIHIGLDWFNTFGIALFAPWRWTRYSLDAVFFIDSVALLLTGLFYLLYVYFQPLTYLYPLLGSLYLLSKLALQRHVQRHLNAQFVIPSSWNPLEFYILQANFQTYRYQAFSKKVRDLRHYPPVAEKYQQLAERSQLFLDLQEITRALHITQVEEHAGGTKIYACDLAIRNFGGRFARTQLEFDPQGHLIREMANL